ncbi:MAG: tetratricopeptide repeat protein [Planctomycetota bacterium]|nr:tetratricopeptide repeat protein [Planctomycetota bacterium]
MLHDRNVDARDGEAGVVWMESCNRTGQCRLRGIVLLCVSIGMSLLATSWVGAQSLGRGDLTAEERSLVRELIISYNSPDLARIWIESRKKTASAVARASLEYFLADATRIEGDVDGYEQAIRTLAKKYPNHMRSKGAKLEAVLAALLRLSDANTEAVFATSPTDRQAFIVKRDRLWEDEVRRILKDNIRIQNSDVDAIVAKVIAETDPERKRSLSDSLAEKVQIRDLWEFQELAAIELYTGLLPDDSEAKQSLFGELALLAKQFVDLRYENFARRYRAQLIFGKALAASGHPQQAAAELELLVDIEPSGDPPYAPEVVQFIRSLRVEALAGSLAAYNRASMATDALELLEYLYEDVDSNFPYRSTPENPEIAPLVAVLDVEEAVSRIAGGDRSTGLALLDQLIRRYDTPENWKADPSGTRDALDRLARGVSRLLEMNVGNLSPELYVRAAAGFRDRGQPLEAAEAAKRALGCRIDDKLARQWKAKALYEIGESSDALGRIEEAALAYQDLLEQYPDSDVVAMASQNFFAIVGDLGSSQGGAWAELVPVAEKLFADHSQGLGSEQLKLQQASEAEDRGEYSKARDMFRRIASKYDDGTGERTVPFFYRARAAGARCLFRMSADVDQGTRDAAGEIRALLAAARQDRDVSGESSLRYELGRIYWSDRGKNSASAIDALKPVLEELSGSNVYREAAILLLHEIHCASGQLTFAEKCLAEIRKYWPTEHSLVAATYYQIEACRVSSTQTDVRRAGELVLEWIQLPGSQFDEAEPAVRLGLASILIDADFPEEAATMLADAQQAAGGSGDSVLEIGVSYFLAKAANAAGKHRDALDSLDEIIEKYSDDTYNGAYQDAPFVLVQRAAAHRGLYEGDLDASRLELMSDDLRSALAILDQRRQSLLYGDGIPPLFERDYWSTWLHYLEVLKARKQCEKVIGLISSRRLKAGGGTSSFAPESLQQRFDLLEKECQ